MKILLITVLIVLVFSQKDYQERVIYYNETDNVCANGIQSDQINISFILNQTSIVQRSSTGLTDCNEQIMPYWDQIIPGTFWTVIINRGEHVIFNDETYIFDYMGMKLIMQRSRIQNPAKINGVNYQCTVEGTNGRQHYGQVQIRVNCQSINLVRQK